MFFLYKKFGGLPKSHYFTGVFSGANLVVHTFFSLAERCSDLKKRANDTHVPSLEYKFIEQFGISRTIILS